MLASSDLAAFKSKERAPRRAGDAGRRLSVVALTALHGRRLPSTWRPREGVNVRRAPRILDAPHPCPAYLTASATSVSQVATEIILDADHSSYATVIHSGVLAGPLSLRLLARALSTLASH